MSVHRQSVFTKPQQVSTPKFDLVTVLVVCCPFLSARSLLLLFLFPFSILFCFLFFTLWSCLSIGNSFSQNHSSCQLLDSIWWLSWLFVVLSYLPVPCYFLLKKNVRSCLSIGNSFSQNHSSCRLLNSIWWLSWLFVVFSYLPVPCYFCFFTCSVLSVFMFYSVVVSVHRELVFTQPQQVSTPKFDLVTVLVVCCPFLSARSLLLPFFSVFCFCVVVSVHRQLVSTKPQ